MTWAEEVERAQTEILDLVCEGCGSAARMTGQEAFDQGWDAPPWFTAIIACPHCFSSDIMSRRFGLSAS